jgi:hypothetical protein
MGKSERSRTCHWRQRAVPHQGVQSSYCWTAAIPEGRLLTNAPGALMFVNCGQLRENSQLIRNQPPPSSLLRSFRLQPSLGNGAVDDVSLNPLAVWAGVGSEVFAAHARLYRRQLHWRAAGAALGSLVLFVQHGVTRSGDHPIIARCITVRWSILTTIRSREQKE